MAKKIISIRIAEPTDNLLKQLAQNRGVTQAQIVDEAIRSLAKKKSHYFPNSGGQTGRTAPCLT